MKIKKTFTSDTEVQLIIEADSADIAPAKQSVLKKLSSSVKMPGFREGHAPLNLVEKNVDPNQLQTEILDTAVNAFFARAIKSEDLRPVSDPEFTMKKFVPYSLLEFEVKLSVLGAIKMPDYKKVKLTRAKAEVSDKNVDEVIESLRLRSAERIPVDRAAKEDDELIIDFTGEDLKGKPVAGAEGKDYPLILGSNTFIPGFEKNLLGLKAGESKAFNITFPADYAVKALKSKKVSFKVEVKKVHSLEKPKLDNDFASKVGPFKTITELKDDIKAQLSAERQREADKIYEEQLLQKLASQTTLAIPKSLVDEQLDRMEQEERRNLAYRGQTWQEHLDAEGITEEKHREQKRENAEQRIKIGILLSEIAEKEKIMVTPEEFEVRLQLLKGQYKDDQAQKELEKPEVKRDILAQMVTEKTLKLLVSSASK